MNNDYQSPARDDIFIVKKFLVIQAPLGAI